MNSNRRPVVCATDLSSRANAAATVAAKLAQSQSVALWLVHALQLRGAAALSAARRNLETVAETLRRSGAAVEPLVLEGADPVRAMVDFLRDESPAMLVLASAAKSTLDRWALGSFSERVAQSAPVPTLVVRDPEPFREWGWTQKRLQVLAALDLKTDSDVVLRWLRGFSSVGPFDLVPCHVAWRARSVGEPTSAQAKLPAAQLARLERDLKKQVRDHLGEEFPEVAVRVTHGELASCLIETAREKKAGLIVVGTHQRHGINLQFHGSVSRALLRHSGANVLCVPTGAKFDAREAHLPDFGRVLVATDFSELGNAAIPFACGACHLGGLVKIVHVTSARKKTSDQGPTARDLRARLRALVPNETANHCQPPEIGILAGSNVARAICEEADEFGADLVCLASHGMGASRALHGSVTKAVLNRIRRPVLVIRRPEE